MVAWSAFEAAEPELAAAGHQLFHQYGIGLAYLATVRQDGGPRLHPICIIIAAGGLFCFLIPSPKRDDLERDGRYALHAFAPEDTNNEFYVTGRVTMVTDAARRSEVAAAYRNTVQETGELLELSLDRVMLARYKHRGDWPPTYTRWRADAARP